ncbi:uncharacterized protein [Prorops nasuta]|uniref:uncharacterized protein n=1 Tax=Prorops nasuta TaxID=863751 RepID=UPI0034CE0243
MLSIKDNIKSTLFCGPKELSKSFAFEAAIYWANEGRNVLYVAPTSLECLPPSCHDRSNPAPATFRLMRFMYLTDYEDLIKQFSQLHTFATLPSILIIDDLDHYLHKQNVKEEFNMHAAKTCALIFDTMSSISRILKIDVHICAWYSSALDNTILHNMYFRNVFTISEDEEGKSILLQKVTNLKNKNDFPSYKYSKLQDGTRVLRQILRGTEE